MTTESPPHRFTATPEAYSAVLKQFSRRGDYVPIPRPLAHLVGLDAAAIIMNLIAVGQIRADESGFMQATPAFLCRGLGLSAEREAQGIRLLVDWRLVETKLRDGSRHLRVDLRRLQRYLTELIAGCEEAIINRLPARLFGVQEGQGRTGYRG
jgi:hypothetical protein